VASLLCTVSLQNMISFSPFKICLYFITDHIGRQGFSNFVLLSPSLKQYIYMISINSSYWCH
jgi:hypothetical protein